MEYMTRTAQLDDTAQSDAPTSTRIDRRFGRVVREGRWVVPDTMEVSLAAANARLDLTEAVFASGGLRLEVDLGVGSELILVVPPDVKVVAENLDAWMGDFEDRTRHDSDTPARVRVEITGRLRGGADLVIRSPKRNFDQWLRPGRAS